MSNLICPGIDTSLWETIQDKIINCISLNIDGSLEEVISESNKYIVHYQNTFGTLCEMVMNKKQFWLNTIPADFIIKIIKDFGIYYIWNNDKIEFTLDLNGIQTSCCNSHCYLSYKEIENRFIQKLEINHKLKLKLYQEGEEDMNPYTISSNMNNLQAENEKCYCCAPVFCKPKVYEHKKSNIKYQSIIKDILGIDTKFSNRFYKKVDSQSITVYNYENNNVLTFLSYIDGIDRKFKTYEQDEEEEVIYDYYVSNSNEFIHWINSLKTFNQEDYLAVNKVSNKYNLRDIVYYLRDDEATIDNRIFNELWDLMTPEQKMTYLENNVAKQDLVRKGSIVGMDCGYTDNNNDVTYRVHNFNYNSVHTVPEYKVFETSEEAVHYLVNNFISKNKKD